MKKRMILLIIAALALSLCSCKKTADDIGTPDSEVLNAVSGEEVTPETEQTTASANNTVTLSTEQSSKTEASSPSFSESGETTASAPADRNIGRGNVSDSVKIQDTLETIGSMTTDIFVGRVISRADAGDVYFRNIGRGGWNVSVYTVEVQQAIWALSATEGSTVCVYRLEQEENGTGYSAPLESGEQYLISGYLQFTSDGIGIVDCARHTSQLQEGMLRPVSSNAAQSLQGIDTLQSFLEAPSVKTFIETHSPQIPTCFYVDGEHFVDGELLKQQTVITAARAGVTLIAAGDEQHSKEEVTALLQEAVQADGAVQIESTDPHFINR